MPKISTTKNLKYGNFYLTFYAMKLEDQVVSLELALKLKELGVEQESLFAWKPFYSITDDKYIDWDGKFKVKYDPPSWTTGQEVFKPWYTKYIELEEMKLSAFTVAELGEMFPPGLNGVKLPNGWELNFIQEKISKWFIDATEAKTEADARARMLIYLLKNNLITL